jgi:WD40 repeat protein
VTRVDFTADGGRLLSASRDGTARLWELDRGGPRGQRLPWSRGAAAIVLSPDGKAAAAAPSGEGGGAIELLAADGELRRLGQDLRPPVHLAFSADGTRLAAGDGEGVVRLFSIADGSERVLAGPGGAIDDLAVLPDGTVVFVGDDRALRMVTAGGRVRAGATAEALVRVVASPDGARVASAGRDGTLRLWDVARGQSRVLGEHRRVDALVFSADGALLVASPAGTRELLLFRTSDGQLVRTLLEDDVVTALVSPEPQLVIAASRGGAVHVTDLSSGEGWLLTGRGVPVTALTATAAGSIGAAGSDGVVRWWPPAPPATAAGLASWLERATAVRLDANDRPVLR